MLKRERGEGGKEEERVYVKEREGRDGGRGGEVGRDRELVIENFILQGL